MKLSRGSLALGSSFNQQPFVTHPWCSRDEITNEVIVAVIADDKFGTIVIPDRNPSHELIK